MFLFQFFLNNIHFFAQAIVTLAHLLVRLYIHIEGAESSDCFIDNAVVAVKEARYLIFSHAYELFHKNVTEVAGIGLVISIVNRGYAYTTGLSHLTYDGIGKLRQVDIVRRCFRRLQDADKVSCAVLA